MQGSTAHNKMQVFTQMEHPADNLVQLENYSYHFSVIAEKFVKNCWIIFWYVADSKGPFLTLVLEAIPFNASLAYGVHTAKVWTPFFEVLDTYILMGVMASSIISKFMSFLHFLAVLQLFWYHSSIIVYMSLKNYLYCCYRAIVVMS